MTLYTLDASDRYGDSLAGAYVLPYDVDAAPAGVPIPHTRSLDELMGLDAGPALVTVHRDGRVTVETGRADAPSSPDLTADSDDDGQHTAHTDPDLIRQAERAGWQLVTGASGQYGYGGPCFHASEFIGGGLARHILTYGADVWELDARGASPATLDDTQALDGIAAAMSGAEWSADTLDAVAAYVLASGRGLADPSTPDAVSTWWTAVPISELDDDGPTSWALAYRDAAPAASDDDTQEA
jgi:hypothetical protein